MAKKTGIDHFNDALASITDPRQRKPVYYLYGEEQFLLDRLQQTVFDQVAEDQRDFNADLMHGDETTTERVIGIARSFPMMADQRVVVVRDFQKLIQKEGTDTVASHFLAYIRQPNPTTLLCLLDEKFPDKRTSFGKELASSKTTGVFELSSLPDYRLPEWVIAWARKEHQKTVDPQAAQILAQLVGNNLQVLSTEIDKVCTFVDSETTITTAHVKKIIGSYREYSVIELKEALFDRDLERSLGIVEQMLLKSNAEAGEVIRSVGFFYSVFSDVWQIRRLAAKGLNKKQIQAELGVRNEYVFNFKWKDASRYKLEEMPRIFEALLDADRAAKGFSTLDVPSILLLLVTRIIG
ncbi:MAG: DNA polymerase III subunit delta [Balneolaceae bacterium]